jgi:hypothetical protein
MLGMSSLASLDPSRLQDQKLLKRLSFIREFCQEQWQPLQERFAFLSLGCDGSMPSHFGGNR